MSKFVEFIEDTFITRTIREESISRYSFEYDILVVKNSQQRRAILRRLESRQCAVNIATNHRHLNDSAAIKGLPCQPPVSSVSISL